MVNKVEYINKFMSRCEKGTELVSEYKNAHTKIILKCVVGHTWSTTSNAIISKGGGTYCKECKGRSSTGRKTQELVLREFGNAGYTLLEEYKGALTKLLVRNDTCKHEYMVLPSSISRGRNILCPECSPRNTSLEDIKNILIPLGIEILSEFRGMKSDVLIRNTACGHEYNTNLGHLVYNNIGVDCKVCKGLVDTKARFLQEISLNNISLVDEYLTTQKSIKVINGACGHVYSVVPNNLVSAGSGIVCRECFPETKVSRPEKDILEYIKSIYSGWIETSDRLILEGNELDIVLPDKGLAIEYNGSFWHSEECKGITYHLNKTRAVEAFGYRLIHITDSEWLSSPDIVKSRLSTIIGCTSIKIFARDTNVREIPFPGEFLNNNHIQKSGRVTKINYGLFLAERLVAVMTFGKPRFNSNYDYELIRFCSTLGSNVVGGASKLLSAFRKKYAGSIVSYSDKRWSIGGVYSTLGFSLSHTSPPNYSYHKYKYKLSRYQCQKHLLKELVPEFYKEELSESEIMKNAGYHKVYDCGNDVWILK